MDATTALRSRALDPGVQAWADAVDAWDGDGARRAALEELRGRRSEGIEAIARAYAMHPTMRTSLVQCAEEVGTIEAGMFLVTVLDSDAFSSDCDEVTQRIVALRGLAPLAATGDRDAADAIARAMRHPLASVRFAAYATVRALPDELQRSAELRFGPLVLADEFDDLCEADIPMV